MYLHGQEITPEVPEFLGPCCFTYEVGVFPEMDESTRRLHQILTLLQNCPLAKIILTR